ncbi:MAG: TonB-dependent receptor [Syntrophothermus sp.]
MHFQRSFLLLFLISFFIILEFKPACAAGKGKLRGFVTDSTNGEAISFANLQIKGTKIGTPADNRGYYIIPAVPSGNQVLTVSYLGYSTREVPVYITEGEITQIDIKLSPTRIRLEEVSVIGEKSVRENEIDLGLQKIKGGDVSLIPAGFESDIFKAIQNTPGVSSTGDMSARYFVRGGNSNQNLVLLDGITVYNPFHALGIYSVVDPELISVLEFYKGGYGPEFGGRLSSVLNIVTRNGNVNNFEGSATAGMLSGKASVEGPLPGGSFILTGRKSYYSKVLSRYFNGKDTPFDFYDTYFKANFSAPGIIQNARFMVHGFLSGDFINNNDPLIEDYKLKNDLIGFDWYQIWSSPLYSVFSVSSSRFKGEVLPDFSQSRPRENTVSDVSARFAFTYMYESKDQIDFGLEQKFVNSELSVRNLFGQKAALSKNAVSLSGYGKYKFYRYDDFGIDLGMRINFLSLAYKMPMILEPRINFTWRVNPLFSLKASVGRFSQEMTTLSNENEVVTVFEPWTILPDNLASSDATHLMIGLQLYLNEKLKMEAEGYYKSLKFLAESNMKKYSPADPDYINIDGEAYGLEYQINYQTSWFYLKSGYSLSWSYKINQGIKYFPRYDYRHAVNLLFGFDLGYGFAMNANWNFNTGMPGSTIIGFYERVSIGDPANLNISETEPAIIWDRINMKRLPYYHRLDLSLSKKFELGFADVNLDASVINVYDRKNLFYIDLKSGKYVYMLPFFPSVSLKVSL